jgi:hypothetical protein
MDRIPLASPRERAAHYQDRAGALRQMAEAEPVEGIRALLLEAALQYQELAIGLYGRRPPKRT